MGKVKITEAQRTLLDPFDVAYSRMYDRLVKCTDDELTALLSAVNATTDTNVSWTVFAAAKWLRPEIVAEQTRRRYAAARALLASNAKGK